MLDDDEPDAWWATLSDSRKASIRRWLTGKKPTKPPENLVPMIGKDAKVLDAAKPGRR